MHDLPSRIEKIIAHLRATCAGLRTGRATPALVEHLEVDYYGTRTPLNAIASIAAPGPRELVIQPWDKAILPSIEKAIISSSLSLAPIADRDMIRLTIPALTEERRKEMTRTLGGYIEEARIKVRQERDEALKKVEAALKAKEISEDERNRRRKDIQQAIDGANQKIEDIGRAKEKEIMTV